MGADLLPVSIGIVQAYKDFNWSLCLAAYKSSLIDAPKMQLFP